MRKQAVISLAEGISAYTPGTLCIDFRPVSACLFRHHDAHGKHSAMGKPFQFFVEKSPVIEAGQTIVRALVTELYFNVLTQVNVMGNADNADDDPCSSGTVA